MNSTQYTDLFMDMRKFNFRDRLFICLGGIILILHGIYNRQTPQNSTISENIEELGPSGPCSQIFSGIVEFLGVYLY